MSIREFYKYKHFMFQEALNKSFSAAKVSPITNCDLQLPLEMDSQSNSHQYALFAN